MPTRFLKLYITLNDCDVDLYREIFVPVGATLHELHYIIQGAMGWENSHLHNFIIGDSKYLPHYTDEDVEVGEDSRQIKIEDVALDITRFQYLYDWGDSWRHDIEMIGSHQEHFGNYPPILKGGKWVCPAENCGGITAFNRIIKFQKKHGIKNVYQDGDPFWMNYTHIDYKGWNHRQSEAFMTFCYQVGQNERLSFQGLT